MLVIEDVTKVYPDGIRALNSVRLTIGPGIFGLLGPNGAGKSTLMKMIVGLLSPDAGRVKFNGIDLARNPQAVRQQLGYLPQDFGVYPDATAGELLEHIAVLKGISGSRARSEEVSRLLNDTNLTAVKNHKLSTFSGGMLQRFGIAQALLGQPALVVVDEPTAGLDPEERYRLLNLLAGLQDKSVVILSTHLVQDVAELCPRMAILAKGRVLLEDSPARALSRLKGRLYRTLIMPHELEAFRARHQVVSSRLVEGRLCLHVLAPEGGSLDYELAEPSLEDLYLHEVGMCRIGHTEASPNVA